MSIFRHIRSALALVWKMIRFPVLSSLNKTYIGVFVIGIVIGATVTIFYLTSPRPLKISEHPTGETVALAIPNIPAATNRPVIEPSRLGSRFPYPSPEKSPFELATQSPLNPLRSDRADPHTETGNKSPSVSTASEVARGHPYRESIKKLLYFPVVMFGNPNAKHRIAYLWSAQSPDSWKIFRDVIEPLTRKPIKYSIVLIQIFTPIDERNAEPGSLLLCSNSRTDYATLAYNFLVYSRAMTPARPVGVFNGTTFNMDANVESAFRVTKIDIPNVKCVDNIVFQSRNVIFLKNSIDFRRELLIESLPVLLIDGVKIKNITDKEIRSRIR